MSGERLLPGECARLASELRELRERTGLSLAALGGCTPFSKSSWERYLNGKKLPPRQAVEALCELTEEPAGRMVALWELAEQAWSGRSSSATAGATATDGAAATGPAPEDASPGEPSGGKAGGGVRGLSGRSTRALVLYGAAALVAALSLAFFLTGGRNASGERRPDSLAATTPASQQKQEPACHDTECDGAYAFTMACGLPQPMTLLSRRAAGGQRLEIRYSKDCGTVWARGTNLRLGDRIELAVPGADDKGATAATQRDTEQYLATAMTVVKDLHTPRVCLRPAAGGAPECFTVPRTLVLPSDGG
ncbi:helix-turn-helix domain-containing protein [Streptomyces triculaminicus]|uniref:Helix-turn-helix domain-containing protein n=2 Tax=Streptomyces TaxID=1883 RepID=A0A939FM09_9ACTN|nr:MULTISPECIES: XRE family transcriptional regulator [Streptomyces]MBO0652998.1 helix-turn-helix domain-containing protein [Streptomyces triculaminicus]QSY51489.1 helix-turn-helix domain-containing protein [Streptomyces griseocarneus]